MQLRLSGATGHTSGNNQPQCFTATSSQVFFSQALPDLPEGGGDLNILYYLKITIEQACIHPNLQIFVFLPQKFPTTEMRTIISTQGLH